MNGEVITIEETRALTRLETIVASGLKTFVEVGEALAEIRNLKLYRNEYETFDAYLETKWKVSRSWACRQIQAAETVKLLPTGNKPTTERQARPLTNLPAGDRAAAWGDAVKASLTGTPTAKAVEAAVNKRTGKPPEPSEADKTPLQWLTHYWWLASDEDRNLFDNFRAGMRSA